MQASSPVTSPADSPLASAISSAISSRFPSRRLLLSVAIAGMALSTGAVAASGPPSSASVNAPMDVPPPPGPYGALRSGDYGWRPIPPPASPCVAATAATGANSGC